MMKEFHIISTGVSLLTNAQKDGFFPQIKVSDENHWQRVLEQPEQIEKLTKFLKNNPMKACAEMNTFLRVVEGKDPAKIEVHLFGTKTASSELCRRCIERFLKDSGYIVYTPYEVSGYFLEANFDIAFAHDEFKKGISELLDRLIYIANRKIQEGYTVYFNPTGGLKAHVIATALAGFLTGRQLYYMNEEFQNVVFLPKLFYIPRGREIEVLKKFKDNHTLSEMESKQIISSYSEEVERLTLYGLIEIQKDNTEKLRLTTRGAVIKKEILS